ncbi:hypothetical protein DER46DRAFT_578797 [Fusarium sp. MPI-SDFR-AT-0072]|nr:hypothetical protein DER46DRAFT_578797 [Fusarium sp. MPI-SDFR-AT-0072]
MKYLAAIAIRVAGEYEDSVERAKAYARINGWHFVSSTSWSDFDDSVPRNVMNAYMVVVEEGLQATPVIENITHVFVCDGVSSIAAAVFLGLLTHLSQIQLSNQGKFPTPLRFIVVEPKEPDCLFQSAKKGDICPSERSLQPGNLFYGSWREKMNHSQVRQKTKQKSSPAFNAMSIGSTLTGSELRNRVKFLPYSGVTPAVPKVAVSATMRDDREWGCRKNDISPNPPATSVLAGHDVTLQAAKTGDEENPLAIHVGSEMGCWWHERW